MGQNETALPGHRGMEAAALRGGRFGRSLKNSAGWGRERA